VKLGFGSDLLGQLQNDHCAEFSLRAGVMSPPEVIRSATLVNAESSATPANWANSCPGAFADLLVVDGDPYRDLGVFRGDGARLDGIMANGAWVKNGYSLLRIRKKPSHSMRNRMEQVVQLTKERARTDLTGLSPPTLCEASSSSWTPGPWSADDARILLGSPAERTYYAWRRGTGVRVPSDTLRRIGYVAGIYKALQFCIPIRVWPTAGSGVGRTTRSAANAPAARMTGGDVVDLAAVRNYLDARARLELAMAMRRIDWPFAWRIIASRYPPIAVV